MRFLVDLESNADLSKLHDEKTERLRRMTVLFLDEASMMDDRVWFAIKDQLTTMAEAPLEDGGGKHHPDKEARQKIHKVLVSVLMSWGSSKRRWEAIDGER